jgi:hypothetical protein
MAGDRILRHPLTASLTLAICLLGMIAAPAAAGVDGADYVVWRLPAPGARGLGLLHARPSDTRLLAETVGLAANSTYRYAGSRAKCGTAHSASEVVWSKTFQSNGKGAALLDASLANNAILNMRSIRLFRGTTQVECATPLRYSSQSGAQPRDAFAKLSAFGFKALVFVDLGSPKDKLTAAGHGFIASHGYRLVAADVACPSQPSGAVLFQKSGVTNSLGVMWRHDTGTNLTGKAPRSIQLFNPSNQRVACANTTRLSPVS